MSKEIENLVDGLTRDQLLDLRIATLSKLEAAIAAKLGEAGAPLGASEQPKPQSKQLIYAQSPLAVAIPEYLATCREPQSVKQIAAALLEAGREFETKRPVHAVRMALAKLVGVNDDVFHVTWCKWGLKSKYTKAQLEKLLAKNARFGTGGHSKKEHAKRTAAGIEKFRAQGRRWGPTLKLTPERIDRAKEMLRGGATLREVCKELNVSTWTLYQVGIRQRALKKEGEPNGQQQDLLDPNAGLGVSGDQLRAMGIIPLHAKLIGEK